jgi:predicted phosphodiesterase
MQKVIITGDTHGGVSRFNRKRFKEGYELTKNDFLIIAGDGGYVFNPVITNEEIENLKIMENRPWTTLVVPGNHENYERLKCYPTKYNESIYGEVIEVAPSVLYLKNGIYTINDKRILVIRGARSYDKERRNEFIDWWKDEVLSETEMRDILNLISDYDNEVDYIISHEAPSHALKLLYGSGGIDYNMTYFLEEVYNTCRFKHWWFGHHHIDAKFNSKLSCIFRNTIHMESIDGNGNI